MVKICPKCKKELPDNAVYCDACGTLWKKIAESDCVFCSNCGQKLQVGVAYCSSCGNPLNKSRGVDSGKSAQQLPDKTSVNDVAGGSIIETTIELFRISRHFGRLMPLDVYVDDVKIGSVDNGSYKRFNLTPGRHTLQTKMPWSFAKSDVLQFNISKGEHLQFDCDHNISNVEMVTNFWLVKTFISDFKPLTITRHK